MQTDNTGTEIIAEADGASVQQDSAADKSADCTDSKVRRGAKKALRVIAIIVSVLLSIVLLLLLTLGILLGTLSAQFSPEAMNSVIYETDFNAVLSSLGVDDELSKLYSAAISAISSESTDYYETLEEFLDSREFKNIVASGLNRIIGSIGNDGLSVDLRSGDIMMLAGFLTGPIEQYFGYTMTDNDIDLIASALDILGIGGRLLTIPLGEFMGIIYAIRFILADSLRYAIFFTCAIAVLLIMLLNRKHLLTGTVICAVPLALTCFTWASFSFTTTLMLMLLKVKTNALATPIIIYTTPARDYMANLSLIFLIISIAIMLFPKALAFGKKILAQTAK